MKIFNSISVSNVLKYAFKVLLATVILIVLSTLLAIGMMVMTVVPMNEALVRILVTDLLTMAVNTLPLFLIMTAIYLLSGRIWIGFSLTGIFFFIVSQINKFKLIYRDEPFVYQDFFLAKEAGRIVESYDVYLDMLAILTLAVIVVISVLCFFFLKKFNLKLFKPWKQNAKFNIIKIIARVLSVILLTVVLCVVGNRVYFKNTTLYANLWHDEFGYTWSESDNYSSRGLVYSFVRSFSERPIFEPYLYDGDEAKAIYDSYSDIPLEDDKKVHIISIMLEAYADFSKYDTFDFSVDPYKHFKELKNQSYNGNLFVNVFAGGTIETERSFLMGVSNPNILNKDTLSYVRYFKENGYFTQAMHPFHKWFYKRDVINKRIGFDSFQSYEDTFGNIPDSELLDERYYDMISDADLFEYIKKGYEETVSKGQKYFNFTVTYQNHGSYHPYPITNLEVLKREEGYTEENYNAANNYFYGIEKTDRAINNLKEYIDTQSEPIVLILFGDHMPGLGDAVYQMLGINMDVTTQEGAQNFYYTPYVFYANESAKAALDKSFVGTGETISPMFLMNELFDYIGIKGPAYLNYMSDVKKEYDVVHHTFCVKDEEFMARWMISDLSLFNQRQNIEYYMKNIPLKNK